MAEIDPVILQIRADNAQYLAALRSSTTTVQQQLGSQQQQVKGLERQMAQSSGAIANTLRGLAGAFAGAFSAQQIIGLVDSFTRLQNALKVSGLEGQNLADVQSRLFEIGTRYGVSVESLATLYGQASQATREFGATQEQNVALTEAVSQALLITGTGAAQASGAILGLSQALASGTVRAEEFNQINEGGLRPLLQAAANTEKFGGSVSKLRAAVLDGKISSEEFFGSIMANAGALETQAGQAVLTVAGAFTALNNQMVEYFGSAGAGSGATAALSGAIGALANNLDRILPALAVLLTGIGVRYVVAAGAATVANIRLSASAGGAAGSMGILGASLFALQARMAGAATTAEALRFAMASLAGPVVGAAIIALGFLAVKLYDASQASENLIASIDAQSDALQTVAQRQRQADAEAGRLDATQRAAIQSTAALTGEVHLLAEGWARVAAQAKEAALEQARAALVTANSNLNRANQAANPSAFSGRGSGFGPNAAARQRAAFERDNPEVFAALDAARRNYGAASREYAEVQRQLLADFKPTASGGGGLDTPDRTRTRTPRTPREQPDRTAEVQRRFEDEVASYRSRIAAAEASIADNAEAEADYARRQLALAEAQALRSIEADKDLTEAQRAQLRLSVAALADTEREVITFQERARLEQDARDIAEERFQASQDGLRLALDLADTEAERRALSAQILSAEDAYLRAKLEAVTISETATALERERARIALASLNATAPARAEVDRRQNAGPLERYARNAGDVDARIEQIAAERIRSINDSITDALTNELGIKDPLLKDLIGIFLDQNVFGPLADSLSKGGASGIIGSIGGLLGGLFGGSGGGSQGFRANGGRVVAGNAYRVNELGEEIFVPGLSGNIIPNQQLTGSSGGTGGVVRILIEEGPGFASTVRAEAQGVAIEVQRATAPQLINAAANETARRFTRPGL